MLWSKGFDPECQSAFVSIHEVHVVHRLSKAPLFMWVGSFVLEERAVIIEDPNVCFECSTVQSRMIDEGHCQSGRRRSLVPSSTKWTHDRGRILSMYEGQPMPALTDLNSTPYAFAQES